MLVCKPTMVVGAITALVMAAPASGQVMRGEIGVGGGVSTDQRGIKSSSFTIAPSLLVAPDPRFSASVGLSGTRFGSESQAIGGNASLGARAPLGSHIALAGSASGALTRTSFNASYGLVDLTPTLEATVGGVTLFAGAHVASGTTTVRDVTGTPSTLPGLPTTSARDVTTTHTSTGPVFGGVVSFAGQTPSESSVIFYREEHARVTGVPVVDRSASLTFTTEKTSVSLSGGLRDASDEKRSYGSIAGALGLTSVIALQASAGTYPSNRVLGTVGGSYASVGVLLHAARAMSAETRAAPGLRGAPPLASGTTRLIVRAAGASRVDVAGDWNQWQPTAASRAADGLWYADVQLAPGEYRYAFKVDGQRWIVPDGAQTVDDGFGGRSAIVSIR